MKNTNNITRQKSFSDKAAAEDFFCSLLQSKVKRVYVDVVVKDSKYIIKYRNENNIIREPKE